MCSIPLLIDIMERKIIWMALALKNRPAFANNVASNKRNINLMCKAMASLEKPNLYDLFTMHGQARGKLVTDPKKADMIFSETKGITPFDLDKIAAEFM